LNPSRTATVSQKYRNLRTILVAVLSVFFIRLANSCPDISTAEGVDLLDAVIDGLEIRG
jgi:hypothetical protein